MSIKVTAAVVGVLAITSGLVSGAQAERVRTLVAGGTETQIGAWQPGQGTIAPGAKLRGWVGRYEDVLVGAGGELASGAGPVTMNCNLDGNLVGRCWGTFELENARGSWTGVWQGTFDFGITGAGTSRVVGTGQGGLRGMTLENVIVYPGYAYAVNGAWTGYIYSTIRVTGR